MMDYIIMHAEKEVAKVNTDGICTILNQDFMPYDLYFETGEVQIDDRLQNLENFYYWCATRVLTLDRKYAKEILNSIGATQKATDKDRARIALSYHCLSLTDVFWVKQADETVTFDEINLYDNHLDNALVDIALKGKQMTVGNSYLIADDLATLGCFPKAWIRKKDGFYLYKDGGEESVKKELLASKICQCFKINQVIYNEEIYDGQMVSSSKLMTSLEYSLVTAENMEIYAINHDTDSLSIFLSMDAYSYYMMNIVDYLVGNTDRHWGNWGALIDNNTNKAIRIHDIMDFNQSFNSYEDTNGAGCLTNGLSMTQRDAAIEAVKRVGLNQIKEIQEDWFENKEIYRVFNERLNILKVINP